MGEIQARLRRLQRRAGWLGLTAIAILLLLALGFLAILEVPAEESAFPFARFRQAALAVLGLVVLGSAYIVYQQIQVQSQRIQIQKLRSELAEQIEEGSRLQTQTAELQRFTLLDPLTGLYNRQFLERHLATEVARSLRQGHPLNGLMLNLQNFGKINEQYGRSAADLVLKEFTYRLKRSIRSSDLPVRVGGDEFLVLLAESSLEQVPYNLARLIGLEVDLSGQKVPVAFAAGWAAYQPGERAEQFLERLRGEVAEDKRTGRSGEAIRRAQTEMRRTQNLEALGRLAGKVAHDFNNLLNLVKGYSELVLDGLGRSDPLREYVEEIHQANELANSLTRQLLAFTRNSALTPEVLDLNTVLGDLKLMLQRLMGSDIEVLTKPGESVGRVNGNRGQIEQVLLNLAVCCRNTMPEGGQLLLETANVELDADYALWHPGARPGSYVMLAVHDTGTGMDAETLSHIFEPFSSPKKKGKGSGLDLAVVYGIVKQSGGYIWVESTAAQGTTFDIYWPRVEETVKTL